MKSLSAKSGISVNDLILEELQGLANKTGTECLKVNNTRETNLSKSQQYNTCSSVQSSALMPVPSNSEDNTEDEKTFSGWL